ncbi:MAG TPA: hypothetical protein VFM55_22740 [Micromonosporaceae bacterium]|nr:hypothetical protein [Micromonosporaceae bacterium]
MTFIYVPPHHGKAPWPPAGQPAGGYETHAQAQEAVAFLVGRQIPRSDLAIVGVTTWWYGLVAVLAGVVVGVPVGLVEGARGWMKLVVVVVWIGAAIAVLLGMILAVAGYLHNRRFQQFLRSHASPTVQGRYVVLCSAGSAELAKNLLDTRGASTGLP